MYISYTYYKKYKTPWFNTVHSFRHPLGGLGMYPLQIRWDYYTYRVVGPGLGDYKAYRQGGWLSLALVYGTIGFFELVAQYGNRK
jgi:hypothetical protein